MALRMSPRRAWRSPIVLLTVRSLGSCLRTLSYSAMAFCSLPCWTNFSAALRTFCLLKPKPNAIKCADSSLFPPSLHYLQKSSQRAAFEPRREIPGKTPQYLDISGWRSTVIVRPHRVSSMVTDDYRGLPKGSVRPVSETPSVFSDEFRLRMTVFSPSAPGHRL